MARFDYSVGQKNESIRTIEDGGSRRFMTFMRRVKSWDLRKHVALIPGMSRSGSTIIRRLVFWAIAQSAAAEFSFFLAVPS